MNQVLLASNNQGKVERFKKLIAKTKLDVQLVTPAECGIEEIDVEENASSLLGNAELKARAYFGTVDIPILSNDTGFWLETEGFTDAPKRQALQEENERELSKEEISKRVLEFWRGKAAAHGGKVDAAWIESFVLLHPDSTMRTADSRRDVILTDTEFGEPPLQMPVRALYISKTTGKPAIQHTEEEEVEEMRPVIDALRALFEV